MSKWSHDVIRRAVEELGGVPLRTATHGTIYRLPDGQTYMVPRSSTDRRGIKNAWSALRRLTGNPSLGR